MKKAKAKRKVGRPRIEIDWETVKKLCKLMAPAEEIAGFLNISSDTLVSRIREQFDQNFSEFFKQHSAGGKVSLRRKQYEVAMTGNTAMLIWMGKQCLGQVDIRYDNTADAKPEDFAKAVRELMSGAGKNTK